MAGQPRNADNIIWREYKYVKKMFRKQQRIAIREYEIKYMKEFVESQELDNKYFWYLVNTSRKVKSRFVMPVQNDSGEIVTDKNEVKEVWKTYFENMFNPATVVNDCYDNNWFDYVNVKVEEEYENSMRCESNELKRSFTKEELKQCITNLKCKKAAGHDHLSPEHIKHGGEKLHELLLCLMNGMLHTEKIPDILKKGVLIPVPKARKDATLKDNNRGITLLSVLYKIYQCLLKCRMQGKFETSLSPLQGGGLQMVSCIHSSLLVRETISWNLEQKNNVFVCFLDARKAFDSVWVNGMIYKLFHLNFDPKFCRIIKDMYDGFKCCVRVCQELTVYFPVTVGVQQGAPLSLWLYEMYINDLLCSLQTCNMGAKIENIHISCPTYADDMALIATTHGKMQYLIDVACLYSKKWRYSFNARKSEIVYYGEKCNHTPFYLGTDTVNIVNKCKHLGTPMSANLKHEEHFIKESIYKSKQTLAAVHGIGSARVPVSTRSLSTLYWSLCVPVMSYACEVLPLHNTTRAMLEDAHWDMAKKIQRLPASTPNPCVLPQIMWTSINGYIDFMKLTFMWRILSMRMNCIYKNVVIKRLFCVLGTNEVS